MTKPESTLRETRGLELTLTDIEAIASACAELRDVIEEVRSEIGRVIVGQDAVVEQLLWALFGDGHVLLEGVPGLGKTLLVQTLGRVLKLDYARIQFTPDLMPSDITGTNVVYDDASGGRRFEFEPGPIFSQMVLADEINRATPKSQAALLEAMQEKSVTVGGTTRHLELPFFVMATQNPIEQEGTYPLPEAQLDRFLLKITVPLTSRSELNQIIDRTTRSGQAQAKQVLDATSIIRAQRLIERMIVADHVSDYAVRLVMSTHRGSAWISPEIEPYVIVGASPRAAQSMVKTAKVRCLLEGRYAVSFRDIQAVVHPVLRHRILRSFEAEAEGISTDQIIDTLLQQTPVEGD